MWKNDVEGKIESRGNECLEDITGMKIEIKEQEAMECQNTEDEKQRQHRIKCRIYLANRNFGKEKICDRIYGYYIRNEDMNFEHAEYN